MNKTLKEMKETIQEFLSYLSDDDLKELAQDIVRKQMERSFSKEEKSEIN